MLSRQNAFGSDGDYRRTHHACSSSDQCSDPGRGIRDRVRPQWCPAQSQAGGLPVVSDRVSVLEGVAANLQTAVTTLRTEVTVLQNTNTELKNALDAERTARIAADNALQAALNQKATTRETQDGNLELALVVEHAQRANTDLKLRGLINNAEEKRSRLSEATPLWSKGLLRS